jgi:hypothetical protein
MQEIKELKDPTENFHASPIEVAFLLCCSGAVGKHSYKNQDMWALMRLSVV